jgi:putative endopeptidase
MKDNKNNTKLTKKNKTKTNFTKKNFFKNCKNLYLPFEKKIEQELSKHDIDITSINYNLEKQILDQIGQDVSPSHILPQNDFYTFINDRWIINESKNPMDSAIQYDNFRITQLNVNMQIFELFKKYAHSKNDKNKLNLIKSMNVAVNEQQSIKNCNDFIEKMDFYAKDNKNYFKWLAYINQIPIISWSAPLVWSLKANEYKPGHLICNFNSPTFTLVNYELYFPSLVKDNKKYQNFINYYLKYLDSLFSNVFGKNHGYDVNYIYACESELFTLFGCDKYKKTPFNIIKKEDASKYNFNLEDFCIELGYTKIPEHFSVNDINYFSCVNELLKKEWTLEKWKTYFIYIFLKNEQRFNITGYEITLDFQFKYLKGGLKIPSTDGRSIFGIVYCYGNLINNLYIDNYDDPLINYYVSALAEDLKEVFTRIIKRNSWLQEKTKKTALEKLNNFKFNIGSKLIEQPDFNLEYSDNNPFLNIIKCGREHVKYLIKQTNQQTILPPTVDWSQFPPKWIGDYSFLVNAMYTPTSNQIEVPLGYLQFPFVDLKQRGVEYNLANIGFTLSHEMSHSLDDWGSQFDENGKRCDWWTEQDKVHFKKIQDDVSKQYEKFASYDNYKYDASISSGENLADISGLAICLEYLRDFHLLNKYILPIKTLSFKTFFIYFAYHQRQIVHKKAVKTQMLTNPHPLDKYRTNVPLSRMDVFRKLFHIHKKDKMWWHNTNKIWSK